MADLRPLGSWHSELKGCAEYFRNLKTADVLSAYFRMGFVRVNNRGRHHKLRHRRLNSTMIIHRHRGEIPEGTLARAVRRSGVTDEEFLAALAGDAPARFRE